MRVFLNRIVLYDRTIHICTQESLIIIDHNSYDPEPYTF